jgi:hypothetical protein
MLTSTKKRADLSYGLVHLTRERNEYETPQAVEASRTPKRVVPAFDVLKEILTSGYLKGSGNDGYVKGKQRAVCLSEVPLSAVHQFASSPEDTLARYRYYGLALSKSAVFSLGGRPVIYLPDSEASWIPEHERWRHVRFEHGAVDFTHEREWRVAGDLQLSNVPGLYVIVWSASEAKEIAQLSSPVSHLIRGILPMEHIIQLL